MCLQSLAQLEILCKQLYETTDTAVRLQAEKALVEFTNSPDCLSKCQLLLERGSVSKSRVAPDTPDWPLPSAVLSCLFVDALFVEYGSYVRCT